MLGGTFNVCYRSGEDESNERIALWRLVHRLWIDLPCHRSKRSGQVQLCMASHSLKIFPRTVESLNWVRHMA